MYRPTRWLYAGSLLLLFGLAQPRAQTSRSDCASGTGANATLIVPALSQDLRGVGLRPSSRIRVLTAGGRCVGSGSFSQPRTSSIALWRDDPLTRATDGAREGEPLYIKAETPNGKVQVALRPTWERVFPNRQAGTPFAFHADAVYVAESLTPVREEVVVEARVLLQGAYDARSGRMRTDLARSGSLPDAHPFARPEFDGAAIEFDGVLSLSGDLRKNRRGIVDYVLVELAGTPGSPPLAQAPAVVLADGAVVGLDGSRGIAFRDVAPGSYHVTVRHRSHLDVVSRRPVDMSSGRGEVDFTRSEDVARAPGKGKSALATVAPGVFAMWGGDFDGDGALTEGDFTQYLAAFEAAGEGYVTSDGSLDGSVSSSDFTLYLNAVLADAGR